MNRASSLRHQPQRAPASGPLMLVLQTLCLPDAAISQETALFVQLQGGVVADATGGLQFAAGGQADFGTYVNLLDLETWGGRCRLDGLWLRLVGSGRLAVRLARVKPGAPVSGAPEAPISETLVLQTEITLHPDGVSLDLGPCLPGGGLLVLSLTALTPARLAAGAFITRTTDAPDPLRLAIVITTFRREAAVALTVARITALFDGSGLGDMGPANADPGVRLGQAAHLFVIDNGQSAVLEPHPKLTRIPNRNLGGAGGFARGLIAAEDGGFTHCLFMDDDAAFQMENLIRSFAFLRLARNPDAALAGAMISAGKPWAMWENGAAFDRLCRPLCHGTDLRDRDAVLAMVLAAGRPKPAGFYGGWWFFAFPLARVRYHPFPFFVRGDDISFSLANRFDTATLNGVMSFQEDFAAKESPQTLYLDLRNHLHHHLTQAGMQISARRSANIALRFLARSLIRMHYDSAAAQLLAWEDVMEGPEHFIRNADMAAKRGQIAGLVRTESWVASPGVTAAAGATLPAPALSWLMKYTLNGHLLPFWRVWGRKIVLNISDRGPIWPIWGASEVRYVDVAGARSYVVRHDKVLFARLVLRAARLWWRWQRHHAGLAASYRESYPRIASRAFWQGQFAETRDTGAGKAGAGKAGAGE